LERASSKLQREMKVDGLFHPFLFRRLVTAAAEMARNRNLIR
jgi:hypothetical protein